MARDPYIVAIDLGSNSIKLAVAKDTYDEEQKIQVLALVEKPSAGIRRGIITNMTEATESVIEAVNQAESIIGLPIRRIVAGIGGNGISFTNSEGLIIISRTDNEILESDVERVIQDSLTKAFGLNNSEILHVIPRSFTVDHQRGIRFPAGMVGSKLEARTLIVSCETSYLRNFSKVFNQGGLDIEDRVFAPLASGDFILSLRQKKAGTVLIDIGYASTSYIVWENEEILGTGVIPVGSDHITADLAVGLQTNMEMAEEIKREHLSFLEDEDKIDEVEVFNPDLQINETFKIEEIKSYARPRIEEIFGYVQQEIRKLGKNSLPGGAVLAGGGANLKGIEEIAKAVVRLPIFKYAFDKKRVEFVQDYNNNPSFINCIALATYSMYHAEEISMSKSSKPSLGQNGGGSNAFGNITNAIRNILPWG